MDVGLRGDLIRFRDAVKKAQSSESPPLSDLRKMLAGASQGILSDHAPTFHHLLDAIELSRQEREESLERWIALFS